jgi:hypothetical protein
MTRVVDQTAPGFASAGAFLTCLGYAWHVVAACSLLQVRDRRLVWQILSDPARCVV